MIELGDPDAKVISLPVPPRSLAWRRIMATWSIFTWIWAPSIAVHFIQRGISTSFSGPSTPSRPRNRPPSVGTATHSFWPFSWPITILAARAGLFRPHAGAGNGSQEARYVACQVRRRCAGRVSSSRVQKGHRDDFRGDQPAAETVR